MLALHLAQAGALAASLATSPSLQAREPRPHAAMQPAQAAPQRPSLGQAADAGSLARARGGAAVASTTTLGGAVSGNSANHVTTGSNIIQSGSFAGMSGIPIVVQNSGANVLIQNATVIHLQLK